MTIPIEEILSEQAALLGVSETKLKTIYQRGFSADTTGDRVSAGLKRVHLYIQAHTYKLPRWTPDADLLPSDYTQFADSGDDTAVESSGALVAAATAAMHGDIDALASFVPPDLVECVIVDSDLNQLQFRGEGWVAKVDLLDGSTQVVLDDEAKSTVQ